MNIITPTPLLVKEKILNKIIELSNEKPNNYDFGSATRTLIMEYQEGKFNPPSDIEMDENINEVQQ